jgi:hypothetical protein
VRLPSLYSWLVAADSKCCVVKSLWVSFPFTEGLSTKCAVSELFFTAGQPVPGPFQASLLRLSNYSCFTSKAYYVLIHINCPTHCLSAAQQFTKPCPSVCDRQLLLCSTVCHWRNAAPIVVLTTTVYQFSSVLAQLCWFNAASAASAPANQLLLQLSYSLVKCLLSACT